MTSILDTWDEMLIWQESLPKQTTRVKRFKVASDCVASLACEIAHNDNFGEYIRITQALKSGSAHYRGVPIAVVEPNLAGYVC